MGMIPYDVRSTVSRYSSCSEHSTTIHAFRSATNEGVSSQPMNDIRVLNLKQTKMTYFPKSVVSHIQRIGCQPEKTTLHGGQSRSWSAEQGKENKRKSLAAYPPPTHTARSEKIIKITRRIYRRYAGGRSRVRTRRPRLVRQLMSRMNGKKITHTHTHACIDRSPRWFSW